ncbi:MAG: iron-containing redox enzyme family protein [Actinomycetota bacterium]|nr:iron-containing redox enzyme family protein [Actinomycetota bacterium]
MALCPEASPSPAGPPLPAPRGPLSALLLDHLSRPPQPLDRCQPSVEDPLGDDAQLALYLCYELHYRGWHGVDDGWEWEPSLLALRRRLETAFLDRVADEVGPLPVPGDVPAQLQETIDSSAGPSLSSYLCNEGSLEQLREFAVHRSAYQLKEADPHTWAIPRLWGPPKAALVSIQLDEYGGGVASEVHASLFADTMRAMDLDPRYGAYLEVTPAPTLATCNLVTMLGLHRRLRGALVGHLAVFEMTSVRPMGRYAQAIRRHGLPEEAARFYDVHVAADAHHQVVAAHELAGPFAVQEPEQASAVLFGARAVMLVESRFARHLLGAWCAGGTSLLRPLGHVSAA